MIAGKRSGRVDRERVARWNGCGYTRQRSDGVLALYADAWDATRRDCIVAGEIGGVRNVNEDGRVCFDGRCVTYTIEVGVLADPCN